MWKYCLLVCVVTVYGVYAENSEGYYHYPAPPKSLQFTQPQFKPLQYAQTYQNQYQQRSFQTQQQQQSQVQQFYFPQSSQLQQQQGGYYASASSSKPLTFPSSSSSVLSQQFVSPALDNVAFNMALTSQGYATGATSAALKKAPTGSGSSSLIEATPSSSGKSLNVKLPLPFNITPLNIAPLPLQAGTPYAKLPNAVTSYGTTYPQRRRR
ncbi:kinase and exchange factor for Rac A [Musca vetustissima]|uniref:kinase and exchange factor for Rac A n=1 Tax=Musca vetustissima TaxID=27455 RepID=UPI002AB7A089|nr:kinase and exchange factor for Rac A [Musca vetustissima]